MDLLPVYAGLRTRRLLPSSRRPRCSVWTPIKTMMHWTTQSSLSTSGRSSQRRTSPPPTAATSSTARMTTDGIQPGLHLWWTPKVDVFPLPFSLQGSTSGGRAISPCSDLLVACGTGVGQELR